MLDSDCKAHELDNLYVVDTSFFPSIGAVNPALTAMANALRVGDHLAAAAAASDGRRTHGGHAQSAATPSPFPPIADYAFLSDCHTGALVAPDGSVDWLCVPRFDSPSVFGSLLDRGAGCFRFAPFGINVPTARAYEPGTNVLVTTWKTPSGLGGGARRADHGAARRADDDVTPHTRPPADDDAEHMLVRTVRVPRGHASRSSWSASRCSTTAGRPPTWTLVDGDRHTADAPAAGQTIRLRTDLALGIEGGRVRGAARARRRARRVYCALSWAEGLDGPGRRRRGRRRGSTRRRGSGGAGWVAPRDPGPPLPAADPALGAGDQGPDLHADRARPSRR